MKGHNTDWAPIVGPLVASLTALWIAVWQHKAAHEVQAGAQTERAALTAISDSDGSSVTVTNHGALPVFDVRVTAQRNVFGPDNEGGLLISVEGEAHAKATPEVCTVLPPGAAETFRYPEWQDDSGPVEDGPRRRLDTQISVRLCFSDAAGTRWERQNEGRPRYMEGTPLPGQVGYRVRMRQRCKRRYDRVARTLRLGFKGDGFTKKGRARTRDKRAREKEAREDR